MNINCVFQSEDGNYVVRMSKKVGEKMFVSEDTIRKETLLDEDTIFTPTNGLDHQSAVMLNKMAAEARKGKLELDTRLCSSCPVRYECYTTFPELTGRNREA